MELFSWVVIGLLVGFMAKTTFPAQRDENVLALLAAAIIASVGTGLLMQTVFRTGFLSLSVASHVAAFIGAVLVTAALRIATTPHALAPSKPRVVLTHGEDEPRAALAKKIQQRFGLRSVSPNMGDSIEL